MKYQSELIKEIVDSRGHEKSSLHYQSECIEAWIQEAKGAYPKLCDYEGEWLNYIANEEHIGEFPYETVTANPTATVNNVVPYAYKSAILKGHTLMNSGSYYNININEFVALNGELSSDGYITMTANGTWVNSFLRKTPLIKPNTKYLVVYEIKENTLEKFFIMSQNNTECVFSSYQTIVKPNFTGILKYVATTNNDISSSDVLLRDFISNSTTQGKIVYRTMVIEYQEGMENWNIPFFRGMTSVKMPVLKATGKNLFDNNLLSLANVKVNVVNIGGNEYSIQTEETQEWNSQNTYKAIKLKQGEKICFHGSIKNITNVRLFKNDFNNKVAYFDPTSVPTEYLPFDLSYTATEDCTILIRFWLNGVNSIGCVKDVMVEIGEKTPYEPFKSNILTVNDDVTLQSVGEAHDTIDCLTGEMIECISETVLNGSEYWTITNNTFRTASIADKVIKLATETDRTKIFISCDKYESRMYNDPWTSGKFISLHADKLIVIRDENFTTVQEWKQYLSQNPLTVKFVLATPIIKTVDLNVINQNGESIGKIKPIEGTMNIEVSGTPIHPTAVLEVPVEAITQNLASFMDGE